MQIVENMVARDEVERFCFCSILFPKDLADALGLASISGVQRLLLVAPTQLGGRAA
jgi:hypothetical protein